MACTKPARGTAAGAFPPFNDQTDRDPCGALPVATINGQDVSAESLCLPHYVLKHGWLAITGPITFGGS